MYTAVGHSANHGRSRRALARIGSVLVALMLTSLPLAAQYTSGWDSERSLVTRQDLESLIVRLDETAASGSETGAARQAARQEAEYVRARLTDGGFQAGDQVELVVEGEPDLSATYVVEEGRQITLPVIGALPLDGVLRSELQEHLTAEIGRFVRDPVVRARSLTRVAVLGAVSSPGFYLVRADLVFSDVIMQAGGPAATARLERTEVQRANSTILNGPAIQAAFAEGRTLDRMGVRSGDQIVVAGTRAGMDTFTIVRTVLTTITAVLAIFRYL